MSEIDQLKSAFRESQRPNKRELRAAQTRAVALSPVRNLFRVLMIPVVTVSVTVSIYVQTSPYERQDALIHLAALTGCDAALKFGVTDAKRGELGYHERNDLDGDGIACPTQTLAAADSDALEPAQEAETITQRTTSGGAKFIKPPQREN